LKIDSNINLDYNILRETSLIRIYHRAVRARTMNSVREYDILRLG